MNPINTVDGAAIPCPSSYQYNLQDVSDSDAGRTESGTMDKNRIGQCVKLELSWNGITFEQCAQIMAAFNPEYVSINYHDLLTNTYRTDSFYVGDRAAPIYNSELGLIESLTFNVIQRSVR